MIPEFLERYAQLRAAGLSRAERLERLSALDGAYLPTPVQALL